MINDFENKTEYDEFFIYLTTTANAKLRTMLNTNKSPSTTQVIYGIIIFNELIHEEHNRIIKIGTSTLHNLKERIVTHANDFSNVSIVFISEVANASVERNFHKFMKANYKELVVPLETFIGNFDEMYLYNGRVLTLLDHYITR